MPEEGGITAEGPAALASFYDRIYLSPHPDDAAFSCSGRIARQVDDGERVLIVTVATADPHLPLSWFARRLHRRSGIPSDSIALRRREEARAAEALGADLLLLDLLDALYRRGLSSGRALYPSLRALRGRPHPEDARLPERLAAYLQGLPPHSELIVPLGVGGHVDHRIARRAAERLSPGVPCLYYEEIPYAFRSRAVRRAASPAQDWQPILERLSARHLETKLEAAEAHASQVSLLFKTPEKMRQQLVRHVKKIGGERYWRRAATPRP